MDIRNQVYAGISGRRRGHRYEASLAKKLNEVPYPFTANTLFHGHVIQGNVEEILLSKLLDYLNWEKIYSVKAYCTGHLATSESGHEEFMINGIPVVSSKSDVILELVGPDNKKRYVGVSVKQCSTASPTNAQIYFTTAKAFCELLNSNGIYVSAKGVDAMRQFCGDVGFRPVDNIDCSTRISTPDRYFWEEIDPCGRVELESVFTNNQDKITRLLLQKGYANDPFPPEIILHKTRSTVGFDEVAIYTMDEFVEMSGRYSAFGFSTYRVCKGRYKEPKEIEHLAPRFGVIQMQRGGQKQHPTQLQFNLKAGYFYYLDKL